ncbi:hypothetical protein, partial [Chryseobacterium sp. YIM B08800]|uniref:hypothetical protein n=1 Tax=Chryseobacterium sp. YIM B08800 TaxID=2984136 RepID=UPI00223FFCD9
LNFNGFYLLFVIECAAGKGQSCKRFTRYIKKEPSQFCEGYYLSATRYNRAGARGSLGVLYRCTCIDKNLASYEVFLSAS